MINLEKGIDSLTNFKRQTAEYLERLHKTGEPVVLTVNGKAQVVVQDAGAYQKLVDAAAKAERDETPAAIREGLADMKAGRSKPARAALKALARKCGIATKSERNAIRRSTDAVRQTARHRPHLVRPQRSDGQHFACSARCSRLDNAVRFETHAGKKLKRK
jgi:prevent-host-death family protein